MTETMNGQDVRTQIAAQRRQMDGDRESLEALIWAGDQAGVPKTELAELSSFSRQTVYDIIAKRHQRQAKEQQDAAEILWKLGQVIEDRWGMRWRADWNTVTKTNGWQCRSGGIKIWKAGVQMAGRGPLTAIRVDPVLTRDPEEQAKRRAGMAEDEAVRPNPPEDPDSDDVVGAGPAELGG